MKMKWNVKIEWAKDKTASLLEKRESVSECDDIILM